LAFVGLNNKFIVEPGQFIFSTTSVQDTLTITP
jgi:hypothetical protein